MAKAEVKTHFENRNALQKLNIKVQLSLPVLRA